MVGSFASTTVYFGYDKDWNLISGHTGSMEESIFIAKYDEEYGEQMWVDIPETSAGWAEADAIYVSHTVEHITNPVIYVLSII